MPVELIKSVSGIKYTDGNGYYFRLSQKLGNKIYLNCQVKSCGVRGNIPVEHAKVKQIKVRGQHNHAPDFYESEFCELERRILERSSNDPTSLRKIFIEETAHASPRTITRLNYPGFIRRMQRRRQMMSRFTPHSLSDFAKKMTSPEFADFEKIDGQRFFIGAISNHSILFLSPTMRDLLKWSNEIYTIYETKKSIDINFVKYVMIIAKIHRNVAFPIAYVGMSSRSKLVYSDIFKKIQNEEPSWNPNSLFVSADAGLKAAIVESFPDCKIAHSWFHLAQALRKEITNLDLVDLLHSDADFYNCVELLQGLPLLPAEYMSTGYEIVKSRAPLPRAQQGLTLLFTHVNDRWLTGSSNISLFNKSECLNLELKLLHRQLMSSFRGNARHEAMWSFIKGLTLMEKRYSDAFKETTSQGVVLKWTGNCSFRNQEKKLRNAMMNMDGGKLIIEAFLEAVVKTGINILDLGDDDIQKTSDDEILDNEPSISDTEFTETTEPSEEPMDPEYYIVEEIEAEFADPYLTECDEKSSSPVDFIEQNGCSTVSSCSDLEAREQIGNIKIEFESSECTSTASTRNSILPTKQLIFSATSTDSKYIPTGVVNVNHPCVLCTKKTYSYACQPCGHLCLCDSCCQDIVKKNCPLCSKKILWVQEIMLPYSL